MEKHSYVEELSVTDADILYSTFIKRHNYKKFMNIYVEIRKLCYCLDCQNKIDVSVLFQLHRETFQRFLNNIVKKTTAYIVHITRQTLNYFNIHF